MNPDNVPNVENEPYDPNFEAQDEELASGGNNKLLYILGAVILALVVGYIALPKGGGSGLASVTPTFMLDDAAVTATAPTAADSIAAGLKAAPTAETAEEVAAAEKPVAKPATAPKPVAAAAAAPIAAAPAAPAPAPVEAAPVPAPVAAAEPAAPTTVTVSGKIENEIGKPLVGATVLLRGSSKGTSTDANGNYTLEVPAGTDNTLIFGYGGYEDEEIRSRGSQPVNVTLTPRAKSRRR
ncbi:carboxypeptidase-like regulatory domain-containing protein [Hymenobacter armeniacus]|uniref:Carboxypeptidase-like regulatory domain-containing protein n=1 Tax=Hymenobacter armeniacus TaxID=2771358 RepID=A0ABR8JPV8_9BACT|nr:carboxypeptidase-like regulatory domain-containing protein [Hymenobacter armeniacus]MBD2721100.1 carboxypeptidase-like regulatory domain-containing protein [Hymenobacter armeniacus]